MKEVTFTVYGNPVGKGRPRFARAGNMVRTYTPDKTSNYETLVKWEYQSQCSGFMFPDDSCLEVDIKAYFSIPKSASKKKRALMESGEFRPSKRPDLDNITKVVCDSLNMIAYHDDAQVVDCHTSKYYSDRPRVEIIIRTAEGMEQ